MPADVKTDTITLTIDGKACQGAKGQTILEVAKANGVDIPTLCHHPWLTNHGACRMCVVEVEGQRRLVTSCAAPAEDGQVVVAHNEKLSLMRQMTLELLFAERNHICPFCPSSGACELQERGYEEGITHTRYQYLFPVLEPDCSNAFFVQDHNRCILCGRCVRACQEVVGQGTLNFGSRGTKQMVIADLGVPIGESSCISCGTCVDVCPTGALFDKRAPYFGKGGGLVRKMVVCPDDDMGCSMNAVLKSGILARCEGTDEAKVNGPLLSRRSRYEILNEATPRITTPKVRNEFGALVDTDWDTALAAAAKALYEGAANCHCNQQAVVGLVSGRLPKETLASFQQFITGPCDSADVDTLFGRQRQVKRAAKDLFGDVTECGYDAIHDADMVLLVGFDPCRTHQVLGTWLAGKRFNEQCPIVSINARQSEVTQLATVDIKPRRGCEHEVLLGLLCQLNEQGKLRGHVEQSQKDRWKAYNPDRVAAEAHIEAKDIKKAAKLYAKAKNPVVLYGPELGALRNPNLIGLLWDLVRLSGHVTADGALRARGFETEANAAAAEQLGLIGADPSTASVIYMLTGDDPFEPTAQLVEDLRQAGTVILQASHECSVMAHADIVLPSLKWSERAGTWVNVMGLEQTFEACTILPAGVRGDEEVLAALAEGMAKAAAEAAETAEQA
ncbi:MAG: molybdopterin-dependent oxidoreductase [Armatimonadetes bacterium]|nr:molybdopterin-dependent oxidoreductase [Armatimonadota bacterium]